MRVLTFGWEFPPIKSGGLSAACYGLATELSQAGVEVLFVLPRRQTVSGNATFIFAEVGGTSEYSYAGNYQKPASKVSYFNSEKNVWVPGTLLEQVHRFAHQAATIAKEHTYDVIHAHDWTSYLAGIAAKRTSGRPLVVHVHATSFDQAGGGAADPAIFAIEKEAFTMADKIIVLSNHNRKTLLEKHGADPRKIAVVPNGIDVAEVVQHAPALEGARAQGKKIILYHGRITIQKGVDYFVKAARRVVDVEPNVLFVISGTGDMERQIMHQVGGLGLSEHVLFAGELWDEERDRMYQSADLLVMPSVSEPFGLVPLESMHHGTPTLISKQSGVAEVVTHALKVDFWDVEEMADKMIAAIKYGTLNQQLVTEGRREVLRHTWRQAAQKIKQIYYTFLHLLK